MQIIDIKTDVPIDIFCPLCGQKVVFDNIDIEKTCCSHVLWTHETLTDHLEIRSDYKEDKVELIKKAIEKSLGHEDLSNVLCIFNTVYAPAGMGLTANVGIAIG